MVYCCNTRFKPATASHVRSAIPILSASSLDDWRVAEGSSAYSAAIFRCWSAARILKTRHKIRISHVNLPRGCATRQCEGVEGLQLVGRAGPHPKSLLLELHHTSSVPAINFRCQTMPNLVLTCPLPFHNAPCAMVSREHDSAQVQSRSGVAKLSTSTQALPGTFLLLLAS